MDTTASDDTRVSVTLTRRQWREIRAAIGERWSGPQDVLSDALDVLDLGEDERAREPEQSPCAENLAGCTLAYRHRHTPIAVRHRSDQET